VKQGMYRYLTVQRFADQLVVVGNKLKRATSDIVQHVNRGQVG